MWNTIDDRYSSFALLSNVATFLGFTCFLHILLPLGQCGILSMINSPVLFSIYKTSCPHFIPTTIFYSIMKDRKDKDYQGPNRQEATINLTKTSLPIGAVK